MEQWNELNSGSEDLDIFECMIMDIKWAYAQFHSWFLVDPQDDKPYTIYKFLQEKYIQEYKNHLKEINKQSNDCEAKSIKDIYGKMELNGYPSFESYKKTQSRHLKKILECILGDECVKFYGLKKRALLTSGNCQFFEFLVDTYEDENTSYFLSGNYNKLDDWYVDYMYRGIIDFAKNKEIGLDFNHIVKHWTVCLSKPYRDIRNLLEDLNAAVLELGHATCSEKMLKFHLLARQELDTCVNGLINIGKKIMQDNIEENGIDTEEIINRLF